MENVSDSPKSVNPLTLTTNTPDVYPQLKVWWIPQVPMKSFEVLVSSFAVAKVLLESLAQYDIFQLEHRIKPDFSNAGGLMIVEDGEWCDFYTEDGDDINALTLRQCVALDDIASVRNGFLMGAEAVIHFP